MRSVFVAIVVAVSALSVAAATPASAAPPDPTDQHYLEVLSANGLGCGQGAFDCGEGAEGADYMILVGHQICRQMHGGNSRLSIAQQILRQKPNLSSVQSVQLVSAAQAAYCPD